MIIQLQPHLVVHGVNALRSQQPRGLMDQICSAAREHPEAQVQLELGRSRFSVEGFKGQERAVGPAEERTEKDS